MFPRILVLALAIHGSISAPMEPVLDALTAHHNIVLQDKTYTSGLQQALGTNVVVHNEPIHFKTGYVGTLNQPVGTGQIISERVETYALGQQKMKAAAAQTAHVVSHPVQTQVLSQSIQVPVQTMQTVQVPSVSYQTVQVPIHVQKEIVEVEKPVPVAQPVAVEAAPKPYVKEAVYARPFQVSQKYIKTRITPLEEVNFATTTERITTTTQETHDGVTYVDLTEENLYFANKKRKIITRFIKIEEMYEAESTEEVGIFYDFGPSGDDDFELKVTKIFEVDSPVLIKNETITKKVANMRSPTHIVHEFFNGKLEHSFYAGSPYGLYKGQNASDAHFKRFHSGLGSIMISGKYSSPDFHKYTQILNGREVEIEERTTVLPGGRALFVEKRIRALGDYSPFSEKIEAVPSFETTIQNGKEMLVFTLTYDSTRTIAHTPYGVAASESFGSGFSSFLSEFKKNIPSKGTVYDRLKRNVEKIEENLHGSRKKRSLESMLDKDESKQDHKDKTVEAAKTKISVEPEKKAAVEEPKEKTVGIAKTKRATSEQPKEKIVEVAKTKISVEPEKKAAVEEQKEKTVEIAKTKRETSEKPKEKTVEVAKTKISVEPEKKAAIENSKEKSVETTKTKRATVEQPKEKTIEVAKTKISVEPEKKAAVEEQKEKTVETAKTKRATAEQPKEKKVETERTKREPEKQIEYHNKLYKLKQILPFKDYHPGGYIYRSDDGQEIKVEEETISHIEGSPRNEYLRYSQVYVPRQKVKYEVSGLYGQPIESLLGGMGFNYGSFNNYPFFGKFSDEGYSFKYGPKYSSHEISHPLYQL